MNNNFHFLRLIISLLNVIIGNIDIDQHIIGPLLILRRINRNNIASLLSLAPQIFHLINHILLIQRTHEQPHFFHLFIIQSIQFHQLTLNILRTRFIGQILLSFHMTILAVVLALFLFFLVFVMLLI